MSLPRRWPLARPELATRSERLERTELRLGFAWAIQKKQHLRGVPVLPPCTWCGQPAGGFCDFCTCVTKSAVCSDCGGTEASVLAACRECAFLPHVPIQRFDLAQVVLGCLRIYSDDCRGLLEVSRGEVSCQCVKGCVRPLRLLHPMDVRNGLCWECQGSGCYKCKGI